MLQIRDWLTVEEEMLRQQSVVVGDVDEIMHLLDKQKVRKLLKVIFVFLSARVNVPSIFFSISIQFTIIGNIIR